MSSEDKVNILLVDDQKSKLLSYQAILGVLGENLVTANSGREALEHLLRSDFAVILIDVCMPEQDGFGLAETIRSHHRFSQTAIIFVSAIQMSDLDFIKGYATGAVDYVSVPIVPEVLRAKVAVFVDLYRKTRQLERMNVELEERVLERTAQLREIQEALRETDRRKDVFLATLAHELRNPLAPMRNSLELLRAEDAGHETVLYAAQVLDRQLTQMTRLIDDLLDLSRISRNNLELRMEMVDLSTVLVGAIETARPIIDAAKQEFHVVKPNGPRFIYADQARLSQVISNLLHNASKYTPSGGMIEFYVEMEGDDIIFRVKDNGIGIGAQDLPELFEPFYQVQHPAATPNSGLGLGLTLVRTLVQLHGGTVSASSDGLGLGTVVTVRLPCAAEPKPSRVFPDIEVLPEPSSQTGRKILVVDDNRDAAQSLAMLLNFLGNQVGMAHDGRQAIECVDKFRPDVIIMDIGMPEMDGYEAARILRKREDYSNVVLVAMTGWGHDEDKRKSKEAGFDFHLVKPVPLASLESLLAKL